MPESNTNLAWDTLLKIDPSRDSGPLHLRLTRALRDAIREGLVPVGSALPPSRQLAIDLGCSRWIVTEAYEQLVAEGYLVARVGSGTRVRLRDQDRRALRPQLSPAPPPARFDMTPGSPDVKAFPRSVWLRTLREVMTTMPAADLDYQSVAGGHPRLRNVLAEYLRRVRGADVDPEHITITSGILDGVTQLARALVAQGQRRIAVEEPSWARLFLTLRRAGMELVPIPVDGDGIRTGQLFKTVVSAVLLAPAHQYPTGSVLSPVRRSALLEWARDSGVLILEDDYDADLRYDRRPVGTLQGINPMQVALFGSLSKTLAPALGLGWVVTPRFWTDALRATEGRITGPSTLEQLALTRFIESGAYDRHLRAMRMRYRNRRDRLVAALTRRLPRCTVLGAAAGMQVMLRLPPGLKSTPVAEAAAARGIRLLDLQTCWVDRREGGEQGIVLGFGNLDDSRIDEAVDQLATAIAHAAGLV